MDQGIVSPTAGRYVRLALIFFASVLGLLILGFVFGSSSASADDGGPDDGGLVPVVADLAGGVVETVAPVTTQVTAAIPLADVPLSPVETTVTTVTTIAPLAGDVLGSTPAGPLVGSLVKAVDSTIDTAMGAVTATVGRVLHVLPLGDVAQAATASGVAISGGLISGIADGAWPDVRDPFGTGSIASGAAASTLVLPAAALGAGFLVLLLSRRLGLGDSTLPVSPVYETDTSPD